MTHFQDTPTSSASSSTAHTARMNSVDHDEGPDKKRVRALKSCLVCRQKKTKCDQIKPICGSCKKRKNPLLCQYEEAQWSVQFSNKNGNETSPNNSITTSSSVTSAIPESYNSELHVLNARIKSLESALHSRNSDTTHSSPASTGSVPVSSLIDGPNTRAGDSDYISFQKNHYEVHGMPTQGMLSWVSLLRKDVYLNCIHVSVSNRNRIVNQHTNPEKQDVNFKDKFTNESDLNAKLTEKKIDKTKSLAQHIRETLTDQKLIWLLVDKFFDSELYFFIPVLDKAEFTKQLKGIIGPRDGDGIKWTMSKKLQYTTIGILLTVMRLTSLSLYNAGAPIQRELTEDEKYILAHPVPETVMRITEKCYREVQSFRHVKLDLFQFCLMLRHYEFYAPEECDCSTATTTDRLGQMLQMAMQNSATREPSKTGVPLKLRNLMRRLWHSVAHLDFYQLMQSGTPSLIDKNCYDTDFPHLDESESPMDYQIDKMFSERSKLYDCCTPLLNLIMNVRVTPTLGQVKTLMEPIEEYLESLPTLKEILEKPSDTVIERSLKIKELTLLIDLVSFINMIYYHLFLHYNEKRNKSMSIYYLLKMLRNSNLVYPASLFFDPENKEYDLQKQFGCAIAVIQKIELAIHRIIQLLFSITSRLKAYKTMVRNGHPNVFALIDSLAEVTTVSMKHLIRGFEHVSDFYYHAWVVSKCHAFICNKVLKMNPGPLGIITTTDVQFIATLKKEMYKDDSIFRFTYLDFQRIQEELNKMNEIDMMSTNSRSPDENSDFLNEKDKRWLEQIIQDLSVQSTDINDNFPMDMNANFSDPQVLKDLALNTGITGYAMSGSESGSISSELTPDGSTVLNGGKLPGQIGLAADLEFPSTDVVPQVPVSNNGQTNFEDFLFQYQSQQSYSL